MCFELTRLPPLLVMLWLGLCAVDAWQACCIWLIVLAIDALSPDGAMGPWQSTAKSEGYNFLSVACILLEESHSMAIWVIWFLLMAIISQRT